MHYLELAHEAQLHREAYIAVLNGLLQTTAAKRHFAGRVGITPQYLSYLLNPYDRTPSPALAHKMVDALPLEAAERETLYEHLLLASERRLKARLALQQAFAQVDFATQLDFIRQAYAAANFATDPAQAKTQQQIVRSAGNLLLQQMPPTLHPLAYAQLCLWLHSLVEQLPHLPVVGLLHRVSVLRIYAEALWLAGDRQQWANVLATTWQLAHSAGLTHQLAEISRRYGDELAVALKQ